MKKIYSRESLARSKELGVRMYNNDINRLMKSKEYDIDVLRALQAKRDALQDHANRLRFVSTHLPEVTVI